MNWKKKDAVLILTVLLIAGAAFGVHEFAGGDGADTVTVKVDGKVTGTYPLAKDQKIRINGGTNILTIKNCLLIQMRLTRLSTSCVKASIRLLTALMKSTLSVTESYRAATDIHSLLSSHQRFAMR